MLRTTSQQGQSLSVTVTMSVDMQMDDVLAGLGPKEDRSSAAGIIQPARLVGEGKLLAASR